MNDATSGSKDDVVIRLESRLQVLGDVVAELAATQAEVDKSVKEVVKKHAPRVDTLTAQREALVTEITELYQANRDELTEGEGKTVTLRGGTLSARLGNEAVEIDDDERLEKSLRRLGVWAKATVPQKRKVSKTALKELLKGSAELAAQLIGVTRIAREENLIIKLPKSQTEIKRVLNALRGKL